MNSIDTVYYINLNHRSDRKEKFINWIFNSGFPLHKVERIEAIYNQTKGYIGCTMSHIKALETFINSNHNTCIIYEDDYTPIDYVNYWDNIGKIFETDINFDAMLLSYNDSELSILDTKYNYIKKVLFTYTASGYMIKKEFASIILQNFQECLKLCIEEELKTNRNTETFCIDVFWRKLMREYEFYCFYPRLGKQMESYSDILQKIVDYKC